MRIIPFVISTIITFALVFVLDKKWGSIPPLGKFLNPHCGFWQSAEPVEKNFSEQLNFDQLQGKVNVYLDDRLVPHIFAEKDVDAYFVQGFIHAKFRLWQMDFQTAYAAGRLCEVLGNNPLLVKVDREQRRLGMGWSAEGAVKEMEKDAQTKQTIDAYTAGVNAYINSLTEATLPIEYKLLHYKPGKWSNLKIALFLKLMSKDLAGFDRDLEFTNAHSVFSVDQMKVLFPEVSDSSYPIIPKGTAFAAPGIVPVKPADADSFYFKNTVTTTAKEFSPPDRSNGSNNWAVAGSKTASGAPILANDPHLGLTLPSIWYEMQITTPTMNVYGATFPGSPSVIIGFNDDIAFGFTNAQRDVKDYYRIKLKDASKKEYWFDSSWQPTQIRIERIKIRGAADLIDTVAYTVFGPVMYDASFTPDSATDTPLALRWTAHDPSNEVAMWLKLNRAKTYTDYEEAIKTFSCPGQNMLFASKSGDIAIRQQARFPARWDRQGQFIMPGEDSSYMWQGFIPQSENPHILNPPSGFIQSANQRPVDSTYPYYIPGNYISARGIRIEKRLREMQAITPQQMMGLQNDYYSTTASAILPILLKNIDESGLSETENNYLSLLKSWNFYALPDSKATTVYQAWLDSLESRVWTDDFATLAIKERPDEQTLVEALLRDSAFKYVDDRTTSDTETLSIQANSAFRAASEALAKEEAKNGLVWWKHKSPVIYHLLRTSLPAFARTDIKAGGWGNTVNAIKTTHGPSWRMIVHLTAQTEAYGIYPGGQSGNPGSPYYDNFIDDWTVGKYYSLWVMKESEKGDKRIKGIISFNHT